MHVLPSVCVQQAGISWFVNFLCLYAIRPHRQACTAVCNSSGLTLGTWITHAGKLSRSVDVYAFGVLLWEMYTGQRPWSGLNPMQIIFHLTLRKKKLQFPPDTPAQLQVTWLGDLTLLVICAWNWHVHSIPPLFPSWLQNTFAHIVGKLWQLCLHIVSMQAPAAVRHSATETALA